MSTPDIASSIIINSPPAKVRGLVLDFDKYSEWSTFVSSIEPQNEAKTANPGDQLKVTIVDNGKPTIFTPFVQTNNEKEFSWLGSLGFIFKGLHKFEFKEVAGGAKTELVHSETFSGLLSAPILYFIKESTAKNFVLYNEALKKEAEK